MRELSANELMETAGGFHLNLGVSIMAIAVGLITGGPVGAGIALSAVVGAQGINKLEEMYIDEYGVQRRR